MPTSNKVLVTPALPYANGAIHLGHLVEHVQVNIFVRALKMMGKDVLCVCGADSHGTPIELNALKAGIKPEAFVKKWQKDHGEVFSMFDVEFDGGYGSTHTDLNRKHAETIYKTLKDNNLIKVRPVEQLFDPELQRFLPDRMIRGTCPKCKTEDQNGDSCEKCGATYGTDEVLDPISVLSGAKPILKESEHYFIDLESFTDFLKEFTSDEKVLNLGIQKFLAPWFAEGLKDWDISRDAPYFGFKIPGSENKYFYVWLDAPIGYISLCEKALEGKDPTWQDYWKDPNTEIYHFIGKDVVYFHTLFWPALLKASGYTLPKSIPVHGMLTVDGVKMSKSRGTFIMARDFAGLLGDLGTQALRYYYACKLNNQAADIDLSLEDFVQRVNTDLVNKVVNLLSRSIPMLHKHHEGIVCSLESLSKDDISSPLMQAAQKTHTAVIEFYQNRDFSLAMKSIVSLAELANTYLQEQQPWKTIKEDLKLAQKQLSTAIYIGQVCLGLLKPVLPQISKQTEEILNLAQPFTFDNILQPLTAGHKLNQYNHIFKRLDKKQVLELVEMTKQKNSTKDKPKNKEIVGDKEIDFKHFSAVDLRAAKVLKAADVEGADKLISLTLDVGELGEKHVFTGLKPQVKAADLQDKTLLFVANLKARKMKFGISEGMVLASGDKNPKPIFVPDALPGEKIS